MTYEPKDSEQLRTRTNTVLKQRLDDPALDDVDVIGAIAAALSETLAAEQEQALADVSKQSKLVTATGEDLTLKAAEYGIERRDAIAATGVLEFSRTTPAANDLTVPKGTAAQTPDGEAVFETTKEVILASGNTSVQATARATEGGTAGNLAANKLTVLQSPPAGIESVTNPSPTGDDSLTDTNGNTLISGQDRETDEELRERVIESTSIGGAATTGAIETALLDLDGVRSVTVFPNPTDSVDSNGLPPYSNEVVIDGGQASEVAETLKDTVSVTELFRLQSGVIGTSPPTSPRSVYVEALDSIITVGFSRPVPVPISNVVLDVITTDNYAGDDAVINNLVEYTGGTRTDGTTETGLGVGEDIAIERLIDAVVGTDTGVIGTSTFLLTLSGETYDVKSLVDQTGLPSISVEKEETATLDASDVSVSTV